MILALTLLSLAVSGWGWAYHLWCELCDERRAAVDGDVDFGGIKTTSTLSVAPGAMIDWIHAPARKAP